MVPCPRRAFVPLPVIALAIAAAVLCAPADALAGCGDYVIYTNPAHGKPAKDHTPAPFKCNGPNCSQAPPAAPMPQVPPNVRVLPDQTLLVNRGDSDGPLEASTLPFASADGSPVRRMTDVFHPPR